MSAAGSDPTATRLAPELRTKLAQIGIAGWPDAGARATPFEVWSELFVRWGRRMTLVDLYQLEAAARGVRVSDLARADRDRMTALVLRVEFPGWRVTDSPRHSREPVVVVPYEPDWPHAYTNWERRLRGVVGRSAERIDHVGSTSVPGLAAKPVIDIQVSVVDCAEESRYSPQLASLGVPLRSRDVWHRYFCPPAGSPRTVQIHVCQSGSAWEREHVLFRDYLRVDPRSSQRYAELKRALALRWRDDRVAYTDAKSPYIQDVLEMAETWAVETGWRLD